MVTIAPNFDRLEISSREHTTDAGPTLAVTYVPEPASASASALLLGLMALARGPGRPPRR